MLITPEILESLGFWFNPRHNKDKWEHEDGDVCIFAGDKGCTGDALFRAVYQIGYEEGKIAGAREIRQALRELLGLNNKGEF